MDFVRMQHQEGLRDSMLLGIGNPLLDISACVNDNFLLKYKMKPNDAILADDNHKTLYADLTKEFNAEYIAGGSVQNALRVAQWVLNRPKITTFFGCVGTDKYSQILEDKARSNGVNVQYQYCNSVTTGTCAVLITGKNRSLCANLGAANKFTIDHINKPENRRLIEAAEYYYISGFFLTVNPPTVQEIAKYALEHNRPFIMNLSAPFICLSFGKALMDAFPYIDILIGNEDEAQAFAKSNNFHTTDLKEITLKLANLPKLNTKRPRICVITSGCHPVLVGENGTISEYAVPVVSEADIVDTNGAGDAFTGGFLAQLILRQPMDVCVECGIWTAAQIIKRSGCTFEGVANFKSQKA